MFSFAKLINTSFGQSRFIVSVNCFNHLIRSQTRIEINPKVSFHFIPFIQSDFFFFFFLKKLFCCFYLYVRKKNLKPRKWFWDHCTKTGLTAFKQMKLHRDQRWISHSALLFLMDHLKLHFKFADKKYNSVVHEMKCD